MGYHRQVPSKLTGPKALTRVSLLLSGDAGARAGIARRRTRRIRELNRQIDELAKEIAEHINATETATALRCIYGVGPLVAADIIAETGDPARFATKARYAAAKATAPLAASSERIQHHRPPRCQLRAHPTPPPQPRRQPPAQQSHPHHSPRPNRQTRNQGPPLPPPGHPTRQNQTRSHPHPQTQNLRLHPHHPPNHPKIDIGTQLVK